MTEVTSQAPPIENQFFHTFDIHWVKNEHQGSGQESKTITEGHHPTVTYRPRTSVPIQRDVRTRKSVIPDFY